MREFQRSDTVTSDARDGKGITGVIVRIDQRTGIATSDGVKRTSRPR
ncbi:MAG TPA: hypothetical protein PKJ32_14260 [Piscinibacter sp.]|nr:hypothetical protein [Piscinibacter sp.]